MFRILGQLAYSLVVPLYRQVPNSDISNDSERGERERGRGGRGRKTEGGGREREERAGGIERGGKTKRERGEGGGGGRERERIAQCGGYNGLFVTLLFNPFMAKILCFFIIICFGPVSF